jgi:hypothetical protein
MDEGDVIGIEPLPSLHMILRMGGGEAAFNSVASIR